MKNNKNTSIANDLDIVVQKLSELDKSDVIQAMMHVRYAYDDIEEIAQDHEVPILRAIIHWMSLNTEIDTNNQREIATLLENNSYSGWIAVLSSLLHKNDFTQLPTLHQSLTAPDWIVRPSNILLKGVAAWLNSIKAEDERVKSEEDEKLKKQSEAIELIHDDMGIKDKDLDFPISNQTESDIELIENEDLLVSIDSLISDEVNKAEELNNETLVVQNVFEEIDLKELDEKYNNDVIVSNIDDVSPIFNDNSNDLSISTDPSFELDLIDDSFIGASQFTDDSLSETRNELVDSELIINDDLLAENETLIDSLINPVSLIGDINNETKITAESEIAESIEDDQDKHTILNSDLLEIYQTLKSASTSSKNVFIAKDNYQKQLDKLTLLTESSSLDSITPITEWCQNNIVLFEANPTDAIKTFIHSGMSWSWINEIHNCLHDKDKKTCLTDLTNALTHKEWIDPIDTEQLEALLISLKNVFNDSEYFEVNDNDAINELENKAMAEVSSEMFDMPQLINASLLDQPLTTKTELPEETSGFQITWDDDTHPELLMVYLEETPVQIEELQPLLNKISKKEGNIEEKGTASRLAHTIKGGSAIVGITALSEFSSRLETILDHSKKHELNEDILNLLPAAGNCLVSVFDAVQLQLDEPKDYLNIFTSLDTFVSKLNVTEDLLEIASTPVLPDFIVNQNSQKNELISSVSTTLDGFDEVYDEKSDSDLNTHLDVDTNELIENNLLDSSFIESDLIESDLIIDEDIHQETKELQTASLDVDSQEKTPETSGFQLTWNDDIHPELLMVYLEETPNQINELVPLISKISNGTANSDEKNTASRMAHTIKGGSALVGITALSEIAYRLETILDYSVKHHLSNDLLSILPKSATCLEALFDAVQMQDDEPAEYYSIFTQLNGFVIAINDDKTNDEPIELSAPVLPDFILNQNLSEDITKEISNEYNEDFSEEPVDALIEDLVKDLNQEDFIEEKIVVQEKNTEIAVTDSNVNVNISNDINESTIVESTETELSEYDVNASNINEEIDDIVMHLITITSQSDDITSNLESYSLELQRFELLSEISGYPELTLLSKWCQSNLSLFSKGNDENSVKFVNSSECWSWIEFVGAVLSTPDDISHLSSLSVELMRDEWLQAIEMDDLQTVLLALRNLKGLDEAIGTKDTDYVTEDVNKDINNGEIVSWDKDVHPELLAVYFKETPDQIYEVAGLLHKISKGESTNEDNKKAARIAHTIKGASGVVGLNSLLELTHSLEDILDYSVNNDISDEIAALLAEASDCMESLFEAIQNKQAAPEELESVLERLSAFSPSSSESTDEGIASFVSELHKQSVEEDEQELTIKTLCSNTLSGSENNTEIKPELVEKIDINEAYLRVPISLIDKLLNLAGELVTTSNQVSDGLLKSLATNKSIKKQDGRVSNMLDELSNTITQQEKDQHKLLTSLDNSNFDSLEMDTYNELHSVASLLSESFLDGQEIDNTLSKQLNELSDKIRSLDKLNKDFSDVILSSRMVSINTIIPRLERTVRQTCRKTNKKAELIVTGNNINIDTDILNGLMDPLMHMLRNAIDHGIESPEVRIANNKDETGRIELSFTRDGNNILMALQDDGAGIDPAAIYDKAIHKSLVNPDLKLSTKDILKLILVPGFSTNDTVTDISGRGVGMDVVNSSVLELNGTLGINSEVGLGTTIDLKIPLTLITNTTLLVKAANNTIAVPIDTIEQIIYQEANKVIEHNGSHFVMYEDKEHEIKSLGQLLSWSNEAVDYGQSSNVLIVKTDNQTHAIHVDKIMSSREVVVKPLNPWISPAKGVIGACHLNDGGVAPVINLITVVKNAKANKNSGFMTNEAQLKVAIKAKVKPQILVVDDSLSNRKALSLIIDRTEYDVVTAVDGMDALQIMNEKTIDLVFTDLEMPRMNGIELTQAIRAWHSKSKTPIVMITSRTTNKHRELASKAGVDDYLTKPVVTETLLESINTWLVEKATLEAS